MGLKSRRNSGFLPPLAADRVYDHNGAVPSTVRHAGRLQERPAAEVSARLLSKKSFGMRQVEAAFHAMHERVLDVCVAHQRQEAQRRSKRKATLLKRARELRTKLAATSPRLEARYVRLNGELRKTVRRIQAQAHATLPHSLAAPPPSDRCWTVLTPPPANLTATLIPGIPV